MCCCYICICPIFRCMYMISCAYSFFFKQKTAYDMRISDWSSDVCSSDLGVDEDDGDAVAFLQVAAVQLGGQRLEPGAVAGGGAVVQADAGAGIGVGGNVVVAGRIARLQVALVAEEAEHEDRKSTRLNHSH